MWRDRALQAIGLSLLLPTALWAPDALLGRSVFWVHDLKHHHLPWRVWAAGEWLALRVPLWAPEVANGFPLMADGQAGVFYPPNVLFFGLIDPGFGLGLSLLGHLWWAAVGAAALARARGRSPAASLFAGVAWGFSGLLATHALYLGMLHVLAWLPWLLRAVYRQAWGLAGLIGGLLCVAGHPQAAVIGLLLTLAVGGEVAWRRRDLRALIGLLGAMLLSLCLAAPQIIATLELQGASMREGGVSAEFANIGSLPPQELVNGLLPRFFGFDRPVDVPETYFHRGPGYWGSGENHWEMAFYLGVPALLLAAVGLRRSRFWGGVALVCLLLMLGGKGPLWPIVRHLPVLDGLRFPVRFSIGLTMATALLAAEGLDAALALGLGPRRRLAGRLALAGLTLAVGLAVLGVGVRLAEDPLRSLLSGHFERQVAREASRPPPPDLGPLLRAALPGPELEDPARIPAKVERIVASLQDSTDPRSAAFFGPVLLALAMALGLTVGGRRAGYGAAFALSGLLYLDLAAFGAEYQGQVPREEYDRPPPALPLLTRALEPEAGEAGPRERQTVVDRRQAPRLDAALLSASLGLGYGLRDVILTSPLLMVRNEALLATAGLDVGDKGEVKVERLARHPALVDLLGLRYLLSVHDLGAAGYAELPLDAAPVRLFENPDPLPSAYLVDCSVVSEEPLAALDAVDLRRVAVFEDPPPPLPCGEGPVGEAALTVLGPGALDITVRARRAALLVQTDSWYPGWEAEVDGVPATLYRVNLLFRGIAVPAGEHEVRLRYRPPAVRAGIGLSLLTLSGLTLSGLTLALLAWGASRRRGLGGRGGADAQPVEQGHHPG